jgi:4a-hydroxytetrahydrobiopterin dehydratase
MSELQTKRCVPCEGGVPTLSVTQVKQFLAKMHKDWQLQDSGKSIRRRFSFANYYETIAFVNAIAWMSHYQNHHPDLEVGYNHCTVQYSTHAIDGLSENDFICATKVEHLYTQGE